MYPEISSIGGEIIVYDNNSTDSTVKSIRAKFPSTKIIESEKNHGFGKAVNIAAKESSGELLLLVNPDVIIDQESIRILAEELQKRPQAAAATARLRNPDDSFQPNCRNFPTIQNIFFSRGSILSGVFKSAGNYTIEDSGQTIEVPAASATCLMIRKAVFDSIGGFDERFFMFMEDTDLSLRLHQKGYKIYFEPSAGAIHLWGKGSSISGTRRLYYHHLATWKYFLKHFPNGFSLILLPLLLIFNFALKSIANLISARSKHGSD